MAPLRIGVMGAARIAPFALLNPARTVANVEITAIAARDKARAQKMATKFAIPTVHDSYDALIADPALDAIYIPLPNSHHAAWTIKTLDAGKHVLCEKPLASNAAEAQAMADAAARTGQILAEAFHWRYHPMAARVQDIVASGEIGAPQHYEVRFAVPLLEPGNIRFRLDLAGGALMDTGCYTINILRTMAGSEPQVTAARAWLSSPGVDRRLTARFGFGDGRTGSILCSLAGWPLLSSKLTITGDKGRLSLTNPVAPHMFQRLTIRSENGKRREKVDGRATYVHQLEAFRDWVLNGIPMPSDAEDGVRNMAVIDAVYRAAGLSPRSGTLVPAP